jgi:hypothetical protein
MTSLLKALVIGNAKYVSASPLKNPANDAYDVAERLIQCGFEVIKMMDCTAEAMHRALEEFQHALEGAHVGLFFFAGHGLQVTEENYLAGIDSNLIDASSAKYTCLPLNRVIEVMEAASAESSIIILDACRNNPFKSTWSRSIGARGLAPVYAPRGTLVAFATSPGQIADDNPSNRNGRYTEALLRHITTPDVSIETMFKRVRNTLSATTGGKQVSWEHTSLSGDFFFNPSVGARIDIYAATSLRDSLFVIDEAKYSNKLIKALKSSNWYVQNPALEQFTSERALKCNTDNLFLIGRNIYQAACGGANEARGYIENFMTRTKELPDHKRKALLDGMLFEVFFNNRAELRDAVKADSFPELFLLQQHDEFRESFDFIAECLLPYSTRFYALPGKYHSVPVDVLVSKQGAQFQVDEVCLAGRNILVAEDDDWLNDDGTPARYRSISQEDFLERLTKELLIPGHLLNLTFSKTIDQSANLSVPYGFTTIKG